MITKSIKLDRRRAPRRRAGHDPSRGGARASCAPLPLIRKSESLSARIFAPLATWPGRGLGGLFVSGTAVGNLQTSSTNSTAGPMGPRPAPRGRRAGCRGAVAAAASAEPDPASRPPVRRVAPREGNGRDMTRTLMDTLDRIPARAALVLTDSTHTQLACRKGRVHSSPDRHAPICASGAGSLSSSVMPLPPLLTVTTSSLHEDHTREGGRGAGTKGLSAVLPALEAHLRTLQQMRQGA